MVEPIVHEPLTSPSYHSWLVQNWMYYSSTTSLSVSNVWELIVEYVLFANNTNPTEDDGDSYS